MRLFEVLLLSCILSSATAGTVSLTGTCTSSPQNRTLAFSLRNGGNEAGANLVASFYIIGANYTSKQFSIGQLQPSSSTSLNLSLANATGVGTFPAYFLVTFQQDASTYTATFPCLADVGRATSAQLSLYANVTKTRTGNSSIKMMAMNKGSNSINASFALILPPMFSYTRNKASAILAPSSSNSVTVNVTYANVNGNFSGAAAAYYRSGNLSYAVIYPILVDTSSAAVQQGRINLALVFVLAVALVLAVLILRAYLKRQGMKPLP